MEYNKKQQRNKHTFPENIAEMIKPKPGMGPVFDSDSKSLMKRLREARKFIENGNLTEEGRMILDETGEIIEETAEDELKDIRDGALFDLEKGKSLDDLIEACENDSVNLRSPSCALRSGNEELCSELSPSPQGLTNDDEVEVQSVDGVSDSTYTSSKLQTDGQPLESGNDSGKAGELSEVGSSLPSNDEKRKF